MTRSPSATPEFVSFHADRPAGVAGPHANAMPRSLSHMAMLDLVFRSARLAHRGAPCTLLTTAETRVRGIRPRIRRVDLPVDQDALMLSRAECQLACVESSDFERPMILLDSDILINGSLQPLFGEDFDVGVTWRHSHEMPINGGLIVLNNRRPDVVRDFFRRFLSIYRERHAGAGNAAWYGDQLALRDCVGLTREQMEDREVCERDGCRIRLLPCETYNFSPDNRFSAIASGLPDKLVLHFKGHRKRLMRPYWDAFLAPSERWRPWSARAARRAREELVRTAEKEPVAEAEAAGGIA